MSEEERGWEVSAYNPPCGHRHGKYQCTNTWCGWGIVHIRDAEINVNDPHGERMAALVDAVDALTRMSWYTTRRAVADRLVLTVQDFVRGPWADAWRDCQAVGSIEARTSLGVRLT